MLGANASSQFKLFESHHYGESDLLFKDATRSFVRTSHLDCRSILGEEFYNRVEAAFNCTQSGTVKHVFNIKYNACYELD